MVQCDIGPTEAQRILQNNPHNRKLKSSAIRAYAYDMERGLWHQTVIRFAKDGSLMDGQQRLSAVIVSGTTQPFWCELGLDAKEFAFMDIGAKRSGPDVLGIDGYVNTNALSAASSFLLLYEGDYIRNYLRGHHPRPAEILECVRDHPGLDDIVKTWRSRFEGLAPVGGACAIVYLCSEICVDEAINAFADFCDGSNLSKGDPMLVARDKLLKTRARKFQFSLMPLHQLEVLVQAWNARRTGRSVTYYRLLGGVFPKLM